MEPHHGRALLLISFGIPLVTLSCGSGSTNLAKVKTLTSLTVSPTSVSLQVGATQQFMATGSYSDGSSQDLTTTVNWSTSNTSVATISNAPGSQGLATSVGSGTATVAAKSSLSGTTTLTASSPVVVSISPHFSALTITQTQQFTALVQGTSSTGVAWSVDGIAGGSSAVGTISTTGLYTSPSAKGSHSVSATSQADLGKSDSATAIVQDYPGTFTYRNDLARTGQNLDENVLTPQNVNVAQFGKLFSYPVDGLIYPQPLYVANVNIPGQGSHNMVYVATMHDSVYGFDADGRVATPLWHVNFLNPGAGISTVPTNLVAYLITPEVGILSTPVIDPATDTLYAVAYTDENGSLVYRLHALDITSGAEKFGGPVVIQASVPGIGVGNDGNGHVLFDSARHNQRPGLLLLNGIVYIAFASWADQLPFHGWVLGYDAKTLKQVSVFNDTPDNEGGGIWQAGAAPAADSDGNIYLIVGNGSFTADTGGTGFAESVLKLQPTAASLAVTDYFTPHDQSDLNLGDNEIGSGGPLLVESGSSAHPHLLIGAGKPGTIYVLDRNDMGHFNASDDSQIVQSLPHAITYSLATPAYWQNKVYFHGAGDVLKAFQLRNGLLSTTPISHGNIVFWAQPGGVPVISADGQTNGIVWETWAQTSVQNLYIVSGPTILYAYDASDVSKELYDSTQAGTRDTAGIAVRFGVPTVANGRVYVGTQSELDVYGLLPQ